MTHQEFIDAILAEPDDDVPRLIFADWLEERGSPQAEFIRLQVELATLASPTAKLYDNNTMYGNRTPQPRNPKDAARFREMWQRQMKLLTTHCAEWVEPLIGKATGVVFERGCVEGFSTRVLTFVKHAPLWYRSMPIRRLRLAESQPIADEDWFALLESPHLLNIRTLDLSRAVAANQIAALADCPHVANLRELFGFRGPGILQKFRKSPHLKNLRVPKMP